MSNAMSRSKSRWKGALLATVAGAAVTPLMATAQNMSVGVYLNPLGGSGFKTSEYLTPGTVGLDIPLYVYATVTGVTTLTSVSGSTAMQISTGAFDGLQYLYYNVNATGGNAGGITGGFENTATALNSVLGFNATASNGSGSGYGSQTGTVQLALGSPLAASTTVTAIGVNGFSTSSSPVSTSQMTDFAKPRAASAVWSDAVSFNGSNSPNVYTYLNDGSNIVISGNTVSFLVETLQYKPSTFTASTSGNLVSTAVSLVAPFNSGGGSLLSPTAGYAPSNYFLDSTSSAPGTQNNTTGGSLSAITKSAYIAGHSVTLTDTLPGDATGDGQVNFSDLGLVLTHYGATDTNWGDGNFLYYGNNADTVINFSDLGLVLTNYGGTLGAAPATIAVDAAVLADPNAVAALESNGITPVSSVPEPTSLALLGLIGVGSLVRRRR